MSMKTCRRMLCLPMPPLQHVTAFALVLLSAGASRADLIMISQSRSVSASVPDNPTFSRSSPAFGHYIDEVTLVRPGVAGSFASQNSFVPDTQGPSMYGFGRIDAGTAGAAGVFANSSFNVVFTVDATAQYVLSASVFSSSDFGAAGGADFTLRDDTNNQVLFNLSRNLSEGTSSATTSPTLTAGVTYAISASSGAAIAFPGPAGAGASWSFTLEPQQPPLAVPAPAGFVLLAVGAVGLAGHAWRRRVRA